MKHEHVPACFTNALNSPWPVLMTLPNDWLIENAYAIRYWSCYTAPDCNSDNYRSLEKSKHRYLRLKLELLERHLIRTYFHEAQMLLEDVPLELTDAPRNPAEAKEQRNFAAFAHALWNSYQEYGRKHGWGGEVIREAFKRRAPHMPVHLPPEDASGYATNTTKLFAEHDFGYADSEVSYRKHSAGLKARIIRRDRQESDQKPAYPLVEVYDDEGFMRVEVFLGGYSAGNSVSRVIVECPPAWGEERCYAARRLAVATASADAIGLP